MPSNTVGVSDRDETDQHRKVCIRYTVSAWAIRFDLQTHISTECPLYLFGTSMRPYKNTPGTLVFNVHVRAGKPSYSLLTGSSEDDPVITDPAPIRSFQRPHEAGPLSNWCNPYSCTRDMTSLFCILTYAK